MAAELVIDRLTTPYGWAYILKRLGLVLIISITLFLCPVAPYGKVHPDSPDVDRDIIEPSTTSNAPNVAEILITAIPNYNP